MNNTSILNDIKALLGIDSTYNYFDHDLVIHINSVFFTLRQLGVITDAYSIHGQYDLWSDVLNDRAELELIKSYMYQKVRKLFDPPTSGILMNALDEQLKEMEWRLNTEVDPGKDNT